MDRSAKINSLRGKYREQLNSTEGGEGMKEFIVLTSTKGGSILLDLNSIIRAVRDGERTLISCEGFGENEFLSVFETPIEIWRTIDAISG